jgi:hypothetical protein
MNLLEKRGIKDSEDFEDCAIEILERFLSGFSKENGLIRDLTEDDPFDEYDGVSFMYTYKGERLAERMESRLYRLGQHYFPNDDLDLRTSMLID